MNETAVPSFRRSLQIERRVIGALLMREVITRFGRHNLGVLWLVGEPMLFTCGIAILWSIMGHQSGPGMPVVAFAVTGYSSVLVWRNTVLRCSIAVQENRPLLYHRNVHVIDVLVTRALIEIGGATGSFITLSIFFISLGMIEPPHDFFMVVAGWLMQVWLGLSLALTIGSLAVYSEMVERLWHPTSYVLFPLSGAAFMVDWLPQNLQKWILLLPMVNAVEMLREGFFGRVVHTHYNAPYMAVVCLVLSLTGVYLARDARHRVEVR